MYNLTLCEPDGSLIASIPDAPLLPRFLHVTAAAILLADDIDPGNAFAADPAAHVTTYARIASSVWLDDSRDALYCRVSA